MPTNWLSFFLLLKFNSQTFLSIGLNFFFLIFLYEQSMLSELLDYWLNPFCSFIDEIFSGLFDLFFDLLSDLLSLFFDLCGVVVFL